MKNNKNLLLILFVMFALSVIGVVGYNISNKEYNVPLENKDTLIDKTDLPVEENKNTSVNNFVPPVPEIKSVPVIENKPIVSVVPVILNQKQAEALVYKTWGNCLKIDCSDVVVSMEKNGTNKYLITAIYSGVNDSIAQEKKIATASYKNKAWSLGNTTVTMSCNREHTDGSIGFTASPCI